MWRAAWHHRCFRRPGNAAIFAHLPDSLGHSGQKGVDLDALADMLLGLSQLAADCPQISELDLNPVMASHEGCWCVDARMVLAQA